MTAPETAIAFDPHTEPMRYRYEVLADHLTELICTGELKPNTPLPAEQRLAAQVGLSLGTVRHATRLLRERGLVVTLRCKGTFVAPSVCRSPSGRRLMSNSPRPYWLSDTCPAWCDEAHRNEDLGEDRRHVSRWRQRLVLSTMDPARLEPLTAEDEVELEPRALQVWMEQGYREAEPRVLLEEDHRLGVFALSLTEADRLAQALAEAVSLGRSAVL